MPDYDKKERCDLAETATTLADAARPVILRYFRADGLEADNKSKDGFDPVTIADREAERAMRAKLAQQRPQDGILGEEFGESPGTSDLTWILDPIDGTRAFLSGTPTWGVLIAAADTSGPLYGVIDQPYIGERFQGGFGTAHYDGPFGQRELHTRAARDLDQAILFTTFPQVGTDEEREAFRRVSVRTMLTRYGMDCYAYALLAAGHIDLVIECGLKIHDIHAPAAIIQAAGGIVTDWQGGPAHKGGRVIAASCAKLHAEVLPLLDI